jgi:Protein of unknown function (DUF2380)
MRCKPGRRRSASGSDLWQHPSPAQARARVARKLGRLAWLGLALLACAPATAAEPKSLALMDFELIDEMRQYESAQARRETDRRLVLITSELVQEFARRDMYRVVDPAPAAQLIEKLKASYELRACNGCEIDIGKALGADRVALCWVQKVSNLILNINISVQSVPTGETVYAKSVDIRGNTDEAWLRGVRRLVDNIQERNQHLR